MVSIPRMLASASLTAWLASASAVSGSTAAADAGVVGVARSRPPRGLEGLVELSVDVGDLGGVGRPRGAGGVEVGLQGGQVAARLGDARSAAWSSWPCRSSRRSTSRRRTGSNQSGISALGLPGHGRELAGEVAALGDGGDVGPVVGQDLFEDVASFGRVGGVGDDEEVVGVASSGGADVQAAVGGGRG